MPVEQTSQRIRQMPTPLCSCSSAVPFNPDGPVTAARSRTTCQDRGRR